MGGQGAGPLSVVSRLGDSSRVLMMAVNREGGLEGGGRGGRETAKGVAPGGGGTGTGVDAVAREPILRLGGGDRSLRHTGPPL